MRVIHTQLHVFWSELKILKIDSVYLYVTHCYSVFDIKAGYVSVLCGLLVHPVGHSERFILYFAFFEQYCDTKFPI